jgi:hypothetical protein
MIKKGTKLVGLKWDIESGILSEVEVLEGLKSEL